MKLPNWVKSAILLSLSFFIAVWLVKPVGVSTQFSVLSGIIHTAIDKDALEENAYYQKDDGKIAEEIEHPWIIGYALDSKRHESRRENTTCSIKSSVWRTYVLPFIGGILLLFGARMAGGCTSGHMMSGMMQSSVSGYVFAASVFIVAIPTALIITKIRSRKVGM